MKMKFLGHTGLKVSELCLGTMTFGTSSHYENMGGLGLDEARNLVARAIEGGINFFDTADAYSNGASEELLGKALGQKREDVVIATKVRFSTGEGPNDSGLSRHHIIRSCEKSLRRLNTDYIDLYQAHLWDSWTPLEETLRAFDDLVRQGKVRYVGCSNFTGWQLMKSLALSEKKGLESFVTLQAYYSLLGREVELELVPLCKDQNLGILAWSPLVGGMLSGKYRRHQPRPEGARQSDPDKPFMQFDEEKAYDIVEELDKIAANHKGTVAQAALNYVRQKEQVTSVIIGAKTIDQLEENMGCTEWEISPEEMARLDKMTKPKKIYPYWMQALGRRD